MEWMLDIQLGRRNLSPIQRIAVTEKYRPIFEKEAKERQSSAGGDKKSETYKKSVPSDLTEANFSKNRENETNSKLAKIADVKPTLYKMGAKILNSDNEDLKQRVLSGETAISTGYKDLIESNLRQRVLGNTNPVKLGRCFEFLNNWYGFHHGASSFQGNQHIEVNEKVFKTPDEPSTQKELAQSYGITQQTMNNYMRMASMIPELEDLIETNIRQRGDVGGSAKKIGLRIKELERLYGVRDGSANEKGNNRIGEPNNSVDQISQSDIASQMGISVDTLQNYKMLAEMIPELEELIDTGIVTKTTALISNNFGRRKNDPSKDRKALATYVELRGYKQGRPEKSPIWTL